MKSQDIISKLEGKGIKPTANRILVMKALAEAETPQSLSRLERKMVSMDKSSIFRALTLFLEHDVVHAFEDGKGILNYELCEEEGKCDHHDGHIHFYCAWKTSISQVSNCLRDSSPTPYPSSSKVNARNAEANISITSNKQYQIITT